MLGKLLTLAGKVIFRVAFAGFIFVQFVGVVLLWWGVSAIISGDSYVEEGILAVLLLVSPFLIGANSYFIVQRVTRVQYILGESERWLTERRKFDVRQIRKRNWIGSCIAWLPALSVLLFCVFLDETWPPASHIFRPTAGRLTGYTVPVPLTWAIVWSEPDSGSHAYSSVWAFRSRRVFRGSIEFFLGGRPSVSVSSIRFYGNPPSDDIQPPLRREGKLLVATRSFPIGSTLLQCEEFVLQNEKQNRQLEIRCATRRRELTCYFTGDQNDSGAFYRTLQNIKQR